MAEQANQGAHLVILMGNTNAEYLIGEEGTWIGRAPDCRIHIPDQHGIISGRHVQIVYNAQEDEFYIVDTSSNGTYESIYQWPIEPRDLTKSDFLFRLGRENTMLQFTRIVQDETAKEMWDLEACVFDSTNLKTRQKKDGIFDASNNDEYKIGRDKTKNEIATPEGDASVSGSHCKICFIPGNQQSGGVPILVLRDLGSSNGTFYKLVKDELHKINPYANIYLANTDINFIVKEVVTRKQIGSPQPQNVDFTCVICYDERPNTVFAPCGHKSVCKSCYDTIVCAQAQKVCPICKKAIESMFVQQ